MIKSFEKDGYQYYCRSINQGWSQWVRVNENGEEDWTGVFIDDKKIRRIDVISAFNDFDFRNLDEEML